SSSQLDDLLVWNRASNGFGWRAYLGDPYGRDDVPAHSPPPTPTHPRASPRPPGASSLLELDQHSVRAARDGETRLLPVQLEDHPVGVAQPERSALVCLPGGDADVLLVVEPGEETDVLQVVDRAL